MCLNVGRRPLLTNLRTGLIDPDTPDSVKTKTSADGKEWQLVVSRVVHGTTVMLTASSRTNSIRMDGRFTTVMTRSTRPWISGTA